MIARMRLLIATMLCLFPLLAQDAPKQDAPKKGGGGPPKNLKILQPDQVRPAMAAFRAALGVGCDHCHIQGNFASDENPKKDVARTMLTMVHDINTKLGAQAGTMKVTCYTCHRGAVTPLTAPPAAAPPQQ